jgi:hypothetical protein
MAPQAVRDTMPRTAERRARTHRLNVASRHDAPYSGPSAHGGNGWQSGRACRAHARPRIPVTYQTNGINRWVRRAYSTYCGYTLASRRSS